MSLYSYHRSHRRIYSPSYQNHQPAEDYWTFLILIRICYSSPNCFDFTLKDFKSFTFLQFTNTTGSNHQRCISSLTGELSIPRKLPICSPHFSLEEWSFQNMYLILLPQTLWYSLTTENFYLPFVPQIKTNILKGSIRD